MKSLLPRNISVVSGSAVAPTLCRVVGRISARLTRYEIAATEKYIGRQREHGSTDFMSGCLK
ncbi:hypothetical protein AAEU28_07425 [Pseudoalteromonas sp. SS15]|uniref:hypothetical protein n=1 Tax=Pseudoalteromonas sp. SS15 TaxID=3139393 RepID=UPI003BAB430F